MEIKISKVKKLVIKKLNNNFTLLPLNILL